LREVAVWLVLSLALSSLAARMVYTSVASGLAKAREVARAIAQGDVSQDIEWSGGDEINDLIVEMRHMSEGLNQTMGAVAEAAGNLALASGEIASANHDLSGRTERTASNLAQASSSLGQVTASVQGNSHAAERVRASAAMASDVAVKGGEIVTQAVQTMGDISGSSRKIADIIGVIDGIAFQTNILALNAAVEAARAGEQGRGFAVVATEVRMLAQRSASAAREIKTLIQASVDRTNDGAQMVNAAGESMQRIVATVSEVHQLIESITTASLEQGAGIGEVNQSVHDLDDMTQQNAALVEQSAAAAQSLRDQAEHLNSAVQRFKLRPRRVLAS
jgi:methyl-accepting chemotaxis protein